MDVVHRGMGYSLQYSKNLNVNSPPFHWGVVETNNRCIMTAEQPVRLL